MAVIDERGRLFGRVNLIDAGVGVLAVAVVVMIGIGYSVFKVPGATELTSVEPVSQPASESLRLYVRGKNFLPFLRVHFQRTGDSARAVRRANANPKAPVDRYAMVTSTEARFFVESPSTGEVWLPERVEPGTYDLVFFNESQQVGLKEAAFTITPPPPPPAPPAPPPAVTPPPAPALPLATVRLYGAFTRLSRADAAFMAVGTQFTSTVKGEVGEVLTLGAAEPDIVTPPVPAVLDSAQRIPAMLRVRCSFTGSECRVGTTPVARNASLTLTARDREYKFLVSDLVSDSTPLATVRASGVFARLDRGDVAGITAGAKFTSAVSGESGEVLGVGKAEPDFARIGAGDAIVPAIVEGKVQLPATLRIRCSFTGADCRIWTTPLSRNASVRLTIGGRPYTFVVAELAADTAVERAREARVAVRLVMRPEMAALIKPGDADTRVATPLSPFAVDESARVTGVGPRRESTSNSSISGGEFQFNVQEPVILTDVTLSVPVTEASGGWSYKGQPIRAGGAISFETALYTVRGYILSVSVERESPSPAPRR